MDKYTKFILTMIAVGLFLNVFATPIAQEMFGIKKALAGNWCSAAWSVAKENNGLLQRLINMH